MIITSQIIQILSFWLVFRTVEKYFKEGLLYLQEWVQSESLSVGSEDATDLERH